MRSSNGWGHHGAWRPAELPGHADLLHGAFQQQAAGTRADRSTPSTGRRASSSTTRSAGSNWTFNVGVLLSNDTLYGQGLQRGSSTLSGYVARPAAGSQYKMYEIPFSKMIQPRLGATWAYNGRDTIYASYARYNPAASSLPRAASWDRNLATTHQRPLRRQRRAVRHRRRSRPRPASCSSTDMTPPTIDEFWSARRGSSTAAGPAALYGRYREGSTSGRTRTTTRARRVQPAAPAIPRELYIPDLTRAADADRHAARRYVIAELDGAFTKYYEVTLESEWRSEQGVRARVVHLEPLLRQLRPGQLDDRATTPTSSSARRTSPTAPAGSCGTTATAICAAIAGTCSRSTATTCAAVERDRPGVYVVAQSGQPWEPWSYEPYRSADDEHQRHVTLRGAGRLAPDRRRTAQLDLNYTQNFRSRAAIQRRRSPRTCSTSPTSRRATTSSRPFHDVDVRHSRGTSRPAAVPGGVQVPVLESRTRSAHGGPESRRLMGQPQSGISRALRPELRVKRCFRLLTS